MRHGSRAGALLIAALALGGASPPEPVAPHDLTVTVEGLRSQRGQVLACLTANPRAFPDCAKDARARKLAVPAGEARTLVFAGLADGTYAVSLLHDENGNGKPDMALMMPKEGFGFSRNPAIRFGPPAFARAAFAMGGSARHETIRMRYMF